MSVYHNITYNMAIYTQTRMISPWQNCDSKINLFIIYKENSLDRMEHLIYGFCELLHQIWSFELIRYNFFVDCAMKMIEGISIATIFSNWCSMFKQRLDNG